MAWALRDTRLGDVDSLEAEEKTVPLPRGRWITAEEDGRIIAIIGVVPLEAKRGLMSYMTSVRRPFVLNRMMKAILDTDAAKSFERLECIVRTDNKEMARFCKMYGFVNETPNGMRKFMFGNDCYCFARVV